MLHVTLTQGLLLALLAFVVGMDLWLEALFTFRPIIVGTLSGLILGDLTLGVIAGGLTELIFAGLTPAGGTQPPNPVLAAMMTTVIAHTSTIDPKAAIGLALPFSILMQYILLLYYSGFSVFMRRFDAYAEASDTQSFLRLNLGITLFVGLTFAVVAFSAAYLAQDLVKLLVSSMPPWLTHGLEIAGGILPAIGFGMILKMMMRMQYVPYLIVGFLIATFIPFTNLLPVALVGLSLALLAYYQRAHQKTSPQPSENDGGPHEGI